MKPKTAGLLAWGVIGVPMSVGVLGYLAPDPIAGEGTILLYITVGIVAPATGLRAILNVLPKKPLIQVITGLVYVGLCVPVMMEAAFLGMCTRHGCM